MCALRDYPDLYDAYSLNPRARSSTRGGAILGEACQECAVRAEARVFRMEGLRISKKVELDSQGEFRIYSVLSGTGNLLTADGATIKPLRPGDVWLLPAVCGIHSVAPDAGGLHLVAMGHA